MANRISDLLADSLRETGVLAVGQQITPAQAATALRHLNNILEQWILEDLMLFVDVTSMFDLVAGKNVYTVGPGGDFDMPRPVEILGVVLRDVNNIDTTMGLVSHDTYERTVQKDTNPTRPETASYQATYPLGTLHIWPTPAANYRIRITQNQPFSKVSLEEECSFPPGYEAALMYSVAERLCVTYGRLQKLAEIHQLAVDSLLLIKRKNVKGDVMRFDPALLSARFGRYNPYTDSAK